MKNLLIDFGGNVFMRLGRDTIFRIYLLWIESLPIQARASAKGSPLMKNKRSGYNFQTKSKELFNDLLHAISITGLGGFRRTWTTSVPTHDLLHKHRVGTPLLDTH